MLLTTLFDLIPSANSAVAHSHFESLSSIVTTATIKDTGSV